MGHVIPPGSGRWLLFFALLIPYFTLQYYFGPKRGAKRIKDRLKAGYSAKHEYRAADPKEFKRLDLDFYDKISSNLQELGFKRLGDMENVTVSKLYPSMRTFVRIMLGGNQDVQSSCYHVNPKGFLRLIQLAGLIDRDMRIFEFETEFSDGSFLIVTNARMASLMNPPPQLQFELASRETPPESMFERHQEQIRKRLEENPQLETCKCSSIEDILESQHRLQLLKNRFRQSKNWLGPEEMKRISGDKLQSTGDRIMAEWNNDDESKSEAE